MAAMRRVLVANRGEIAVRVIRACHKLGLEAVAVHSEADADALHVAEADSAVFIGPSPPRSSYLVMDKLIHAARQGEADAVHPGYGFLAESPAFARAVVAGGFVWVGPQPQTIEDMGDKERARLLAKAADVPILPGSARYPPGDLDGLEEEAEAIGYPLLVKACAGGGGIGMRRVDSPAALKQVVAATQDVAAKTFGDGTIYLERFVFRPRHVEIQVFGMGEGHAVHMYERDCSIQRRFQKVIEETPSPLLSRTTCESMAAAACALARQERYRGAGTVEFVVDDEESFYFLEMNTRIQVEHPVTEATTGLDLVELQLREAGGEDLSWLAQDQIRARGHAIECRICAEDPDKNFMPSPGKLVVFDPPVEENGVRVDTGVRQGDHISFYYDSMIAKVIVRAESRPAAIDRMLAALASFRVEGVTTTIPFLRRAIGHPAFRAGETHTGFVEMYSKDILEA
jgi:3-methylcrotonyl-CoA carboxylase alpha subunit